VDEYRLMVFPVLVGSGRRLFADGTVPSALELVEAATSSTGVAIHTYRRAGGLRTGSFALEP
jgi:dihydrofolate reductase